MAEDVKPYVEEYESKLVLLAQADGLELISKTRKNGAPTFTFSEPMGLLATVKLHASSREGFGINKSEAKTKDLVLAFLWYRSDIRRRRLFLLTHAQAVEIGEKKGWLTTESWQRGAYTTSQPDKELKKLLEPYEYKLGSFIKIASHPAQYTLQGPTDEDIRLLLENSPASTGRQLDALIAAIEAHEGPFGGGEDLKKTGDHTFEIVNAPANPLIEQTRRFLYDNDLIVSFRWAEWPLGKEIFDRTGPGRFDDVDPPTAVRYLTAMVRSDRFGSGSWSGLFAKGDIAPLLRIVLTGL